MAIIYSTLDTIEQYDFLFREFNAKHLNYNKADIKVNLIYLVAGLGLSNSIHERFVKSIIEDCSNMYNFSNNQKDKLIRRYKSPKCILNLVNDLGLDLKEEFDLMKNDLYPLFSYIDSYNGITTAIALQRDTRNDYLHGDFNMQDEIEKSIFKDSIIDFQIMHSFLLKIIRSTFIKTFPSIKNISMCLT